MRKSYQQLFFGICCLAICCILSGQSAKNEPTPLQPIPTQFSKKLDELQKKDDLSGWLSAYLEYVYNDPVKRVYLLEQARVRAWRKCTSDEEKQHWFDCLAAEGYYLMYSGNILRSIDAYETAYNFYFEKPIPQADVLEYVLKPLGNNYTRLGDYDRAFFIQEKSLSLAEKDDPSQIAPICHNLATTAIWKDELAMAQQFCEKGLKVVKQGSAMNGLLLSTLAEILLKKGKLDSAAINSKAAISMLSPYLSGKTEINAPYWLRGAWQGMGDIQRAKGRSVAALASYQTAIKITDQYYKGERKREKAQLLVSCGNVLLQLGQPQKAIIEYDNALKLLLASFQPATLEDLPRSKDLYGENTLLDALHGKADCLNTLSKKDKALECYMLLYVVERKLRNEFFSNTAKAQQQKENRRWVESAITAAYELWKSTGRKTYAHQVLLIAEMSKAQLLLDEMMNIMRYSRTLNKDSLLSKEQQLIRAIAYYEREAALNPNLPDSDQLAAKKELQFELSLLQKQVREKYPSTGNYKAVEEIPSIESLLEHIPVNATAVEFFSGEKNSYIIEAEKGAVLAVRKLDDAVQVHQTVKDFVATYFQQGPSNMMNLPKQYYDDAYRIYHWLWPDPVSNKHSQCIIIPDGIFGYLPFDALVTDPHYADDPGQWPFLIGQRNLYYSYSLQTAQQSEQVQRPHKLFAGFFVSFDSSQQLSLPAVKKEYDAIRDIVEGNFFREKEASLAAFNKSLSEVNLLHISTHSFLQGKEGLPVLQLADDKFFLFELYGKIFRPQLVVLSACRTGYGMLAEGEGIISLARGFTATGAGGIVAGLWNMNDETTARLEGMFYKRLSSGAPPADALRDAKLQWLQQKGQGFQKLPYFWAGMVYSGDNRVVEMQEKRTPAKFWWIAILLVVGLVIFFILRKRNTPA